MYLVVVFFLHENYIVHGDVCGLSVCFLIGGKNLTRGEGEWGIRGNKLKDYCIRP